MKTRLNTKGILTLVVAVLLVVLVSGLVLADNLENDIVSDPALNPNRQITLTVGSETASSRNVRFWVQPTGGGNDGDPQCNFDTSSEALKFAINAPEGVTATPSELTFNECKDGNITNDQSVKFAVGPTAQTGVVTFTIISNTSGGSFDFSNATFKVNVIIPDSTPPVVTPSLVGTKGNGDWYTSDVIVSWTVSDPDSAITSSSGCGGTTINSDTSGTPLSCTATSTGGTTTQSVTIKRDATKPGLSWSGITEGQTFTYGDVPAASCTATDGGSGPASCDVSGYSAEVGMHTLKATASDLAGNTTVQSITYMVNPRPVQVTADAKSKVYGEADPIQTYNVTSGSLINGDSFAGGLSRNPGENVGNYTITQGSLSLGSNYVITFVPASLEITQRAVKVTADLQTKVYGDSDPALTYQVTSGSLVPGDSFTGALTRDAGESVRDYPIQQGSLALSSNYNLSYIGANLTVTARPVTVTADAKTKVYGDADPALTYQITSGSLAFSDAFSGALTRDAGENIGQYAINQGTLALGSNYMLSFSEANLIISQRPITVTADSQTKVLGTVDPALTYQVTFGSLVGNDAFSGSLARDAGENVGPHAITQGTLTLGSNYNLTFVGAALTITYAPAGAMCYGGLGHTILQPVNSDGTSVFKQGSTVPAKFRVCDANGSSIGTPGVVSSFRLVKTVTGTIISTVDESVYSTTPDMAFRWSSSDQLWIFNMNTKNLKANTTYFYEITLNDGTKITFQFGLR